MLKINIFLTILILAANYAAAQSNLQKFKSQSPYWKALEVQRQAIEKEYQASDLAVAPKLTLEATNFKDNRKALLVLPVKQEELFLSAGISKYFSTGTNIEFLTNTTSTEYRTIAGTNHLGSFQLSLSQNLWKDFFGESDKIRRAKNLHNYELKLLQIKNDQAQLLIRFEQVLWDYIVAQKELLLRQESLRRWTDIEKWMNDRYRRLAAELVDVKQISATRILRDIQVKTVKQQLINLKNELDQIGGDDFSNQVIMVESLLDVSKQDILSQQNATSLRTLILEKAADLSEQEMLSALENAKPDLKFALSLGRRGIDDTLASAWLDSYDDNQFFTQASLTLSTPLDFSLLKKATDASKLMFEAANIRKMQAMSSSKLEWEHLQGQITEHFERIKLLKKLTSAQHARNEAQRNRFLKGRSTSLEVVTAEQETLDAELTLRTTQAAFKKLISQYRLFEAAPTGE